MTADRFALKSWNEIWYVFDEKNRVYSGGHVYEVAQALLAKLNAHAIPYLSQRWLDHTQTYRRVSVADEPFWEISEQPDHPEFPEHPNHPCIP